MQPSILFVATCNNLLESLVPDIRATNEPKRQSCGAPDYILTKKEIPVGFIEAKTLATKTLKEQRKQETKNSSTVIRLR
jgi:predicted type IV restriction endonuclease